MIELKPCPFCGDSAEVYTLIVVTPMMNRKVEKQCVGCFRCEAFVMAKYQDNAIGKWNMRVKE